MRLTSVKILVICRSDDAAEHKVGRGATLKPKDFNLSLFSEVINFCHPSRRTSSAYHGHIELLVMKQSYSH